MFQCCVFRATLKRALRERLPGCLKTYQRQASTVMAGKSEGSIRVGTSAFAAMFSWGGQTQGRAQRAPVETAPSDWNVERKDVDFMLLRIVAKAIKRPSRKRAPRSN